MHILVGLLDHPLFLMGSVLIPLIVTEGRCSSIVNVSSSSSSGSSASIISFIDHINAQLIIEVAIQ